jgi:IS5 family transposase
VWHGKRDPGMHQTKKGNRYYLGMKAHIGVDDEPGLVHSVVCADVGYTGVEKPIEHDRR